MTVELSAENVRGRNLSYFTMAVFSGQFLPRLWNIYLGELITYLLFAPF
ncbi:hypothetical protein ACOBV9_09170 [Pseudoalteromonas espejiana]